MGIEPTQPAWKAGVLPLNYTRIFSYLRCSHPVTPTAKIIIAQPCISVKGFPDFFSKPTAPPPCRIYCQRPDPLYPLPAGRSGSMTISLCMIVKNEEAVIGRCLDAVQTLQMKLFW